MEQPEPQPSEGIRERFLVMHESLRQIAGRMMRDQQARSLAPTELVAEAFMKLSSEEDRRVRDDRSMLGAKPDAAFKACFGAACRDVLVDRVRKRVALKRGGGQADAALHSQIMMPDQGEVVAAAVGELLGEMKGAGRAARAAGRSARLRGPVGARVRRAARRVAAHRGPALGVRTEVAQGAARRRRVDAAPPRSEVI